MYAEKKGWRCKCWPRVCSQTFVPQNPQNAKSLRKSRWDKNSDFGWFFVIFGVERHESVFFDSHSLPRCSSVFPRCFLGVPRCSSVFPRCFLGVSSVFLGVSSVLRGGGSDIGVANHFLARLAKFSAFGKIARSHGQILHFAEISGEFRHAHRGRVELSRTCDFFHKPVKQTNVSVGGGWHQDERFGISWLEVSKKGGGGLGECLCKGFIPWLIHDKYFNMKIIRLGVCLHSQIPSNTFLSNFLCQNYPRKTTKRRRLCLRRCALPPVFLAMKPMQKCTRFQNPFFANGASFQVIRVTKAQCERWHQTPRSQVYFFSTSASQIHLRRKKPCFRPTAGFANSKSMCSRSEGHMRLAWPLSTHLLPRYAVREFPLLALQFSACWTTYREVCFGRSSPQNLL